MLNIEKAFVRRSVDASPEKVIFVASNQQLTDLSDFAQTLESFVFSMSTLHIMLDNATLHLQHDRYNF